jgi:hypothetical protein
MTSTPETSQSIGSFIEPPTVSLPPDLRHIEPVIYGDIFDFPPTLEEIWRYSPLPLSRDELSRLLDDNGPSNPAADLVGCRDGYYHLPGREEIVQKRQQRKKSSLEIWERARRVAGRVQHIPFIRSMAVTGSLATDNSDEDGDPDFLVITARNRIWTVFFFLGTIQRLTSVQTLCPNFYISAESLRITPMDFYNAREVTQAIPLTGFELYQQFLEANRWVEEFVPNYQQVAHREERPLPRHGLLRFLGQLFETIAGGRLGDGLERLLRRLLFNRLPGHYRSFGGEAPQTVLEAARQGRELRFHGLHHRTLIQEAIDERVRRVREMAAVQRPTG